VARLEFKVPVMTKVDRNNDTGTVLRVRPADGMEKERLNTLRNLCAALLGLPSTSGLIFHFEFRLGYLVQGIDEVHWQTVSDQLNQRLRDAERAFTLSTILFCTFEYVDSYTPLLILANMASP